MCKNHKQKENSGYKKLFPVLMLIVILSTLILGVSARDIDFQDYNIISIYQKFNLADAGNRDAPCRRGDAGDS